MQQSLPRLAIRLQRFRSRALQRHIALLLPFPPHQDHSVRLLDIIQLDPHQLRVAQPAAVQQLEDRAIAFRKARALRHLAVQETVDLLRCGHARQFFRQAWRGHQLSRVLLHYSFARQPLVK